MVHHHRHQWFSSDGTVRRMWYSTVCNVCVYVMLRFWHWWWFIIVISDSVPMARCGGCGTVQYVLCVCDVKVLTLMMVHHRHQWFSSDGTVWRMRYSTVCNVCMYAMLRFWHWWWFIIIISDSVPMARCGGCGTVQCVCDVEVLTLMMVHHHRHQWFSSNGTVWRMWYSTVCIVCMWC